MAVSKMICEKQQQSPTPPSQYHANTHTHTQQHTMFSTLCECLMARAAWPTAGDVLERARESAVCTATQCFPSQQDAFDVHAPPARAMTAVTDDVATASLLLFSLYYALVAFTRARGVEKTG